MTAAENDEELGTLVLGMPLLQLAAVHAAVAEGFELGDVLTVEGVAQQRWRAAEAAWNARMAEEPPELERYRQLLAEQQQRLARPIEPLDGDLDAWVTFLRIYGDHQQPFHLLDGLGIGLNDLARLQRRWTQRMEQEPSIGKRAGKLADKLDKQQKKGEPPLLPLITGGESELTASAAAGFMAAAEAQPDSAPDAAHAGPPLLGLDEFAALSAELRLGDDEQDKELLVRFGLTAAQAVAIDEAWRARLECDAELMADYRSLSAHYEQAILLRWRSADHRARREAAPFSAVPTSIGPAAPLAPLPIRAPQPPPAAVSRTDPSCAVLAHAEALPFHGQISSLAPAAMSLTPLPSTGAFAETTGDEIPALRDSEVLPFGDRRRSYRTAQMPQMPVVEDALPFSGAISSVTPIGFSLAVPPSATVDDTSDMGTPVPDSYVLPFRPHASSAGEPKPAAPPKRRSQPSKRKRPKQRALFMRRVDPLAATAAIKVIDPRGAAGAKEQKPDEVPGSGAPPPDLTVEQLASLHAELTLRRQDAATIRRRYQIPDAATQRLVEHGWFKRFATNATQRQRYETKLHEFLSWLLSQH